MPNNDERVGHLDDPGHDYFDVELGQYLPDVESTLSALDQDAVLRRIWDRDHTAWADEPDEIDNRLGWLTVSDEIVEQVSVLTEFAQEVKDAGFRHVVLLGMGGSSLGPEVVRRTIGSADGFPELIVLDSTVPESVDSVTMAIDLSRTLFLVSSKSGGTIEPNSFYSHFRALVEQAVGSEAAGKSFVAITDPDTSLEELAHSEGFLAVFSNPSDIGGRYSVLSFFGLVPAALMGVDIASLLQRANDMRESCASSVDSLSNPGAFLGAALATLAAAGRDKLTLVTSPSIGSFGLWAEQLIAESLGKNDKGVVPVADEPSIGVNSYGDDRFFVYLRVAGDDNLATDESIRLIAERGQPIVRLDLRDRYDLGAEFFRWEFATAVAGAIVKINPFDQPNVQAAKNMTDSVLEGYRATGKLPDGGFGISAQELLGSITDGDYLAIMAYVAQTPEIGRAFETLRLQVAERYGIATTLGYGPRFLHSTGQLHKGGPPSGAFLQITTRHGDGGSIPGAHFSFGTLADAQALGDRKALVEAGRRVARLHLESDVAAGVLDLATEIAGA
jgi:glucose-6-phosphate isomerase/transaldolase/glucose-6-phosphate isomerase